MPKKPVKTAIKATWKIESPVIYKANAFRSVYTPNSITLYFGLLDPEAMLPPEIQKSDKIVEIKTLARYCLDIDDLRRLKDEVDKTFKGLKDMGALKNAT